MLWRGEKMCPETSGPFCLSFFFSPSANFYELYPTLHYLSLSLYSASKLCLHLRPLCHTLRPSHCPCVRLSVTYTSHQQPLAAGGLWSLDCCDCSLLRVTRVSKQSWPSWILGHTTWMAFPLNAELAADWLFSEPMRAGLSLGQVDMTPEDVGCFTGFSF